MKKILLVISTIVLLVSLALCVNAHPGRTDGDGGHTDRSTGEYHYHHGYSAHSHYDMDGDGDADCPYDFDDKTNHSSNGNYRSKEEQKPIEYSKQQEEQQSTEYSKKQSKGQKINTDLIVNIIVAIIVVVFWILPLFFSKK